MTEELKPKLDITRDAKGVPTAARCSGCGESLPQGELRITTKPDLEAWFQKAFNTHIREKHSGARLVEHEGVKRCSVCGYPFAADVEPSIERAFGDHVLKAHKPYKESSQ